jgi:hypothetical protein
MHCSDRSTVQCAGLGLVLPDLDGESNSMCVYVCMCVCMCTYGCMYECMYVCMYECMYVCMRVCVCVYVHIDLLWEQYHN